MIIFLVNIFVGLSALEHIYFMILEMFLWTTPRGYKSFGLTAEFAKSTATLAANQGLYNGFLAAGLIWSLVHSGESTALGLKMFFLSCVAIAGIYGGKTVSKKIFYIQAVPALLGLIFLYLGIATGEFHY